MYFIKILLIVLIPLLGTTQSIDKRRAQITEEDGSPLTYPYKIKFPNGSVTDNGDNTTSISVLTETSADLRYLMLDCSNDPLTENLALSANKAGLYGISIRNSNSNVVDVAGATMTLINDQGYWGLQGMTSSASTILGGSLINTYHTYNQGYGDSLYTVDGNKDHVFYSDPTDSHNFSALSNEILRLEADGDIMSALGSFSIGSSLSGGSNNYLIIDGETTSSRITLTGSNSGIKVDSNLWMNNDIRFGDKRIMNFGDSEDSRIMWRTDGNASLMFGTLCGNANYSGYVSLSERGDMSSSNRWPAGTTVNPIWRVYSADETQADDYIEMKHDQTDGEIKVGNGDLNLDADSYVANGTYSGAVNTGENSTTNLVLENSDTATSSTDLKYPPNITFKGSGWTGSAEQTTEHMIVSDPTNNGNPTFYIKVREGGTGSWTNILWINSFGQFGLPINLASYSIGEAISEKFIMSNDKSASASLDQFSGTAKMYGLGWETTGGSSECMSIDWHVAPEQGTLGAVGRLNFFTGNDNYYPSMTNELLSLGWGDDSGVTGLSLNRLGTFSDYVFDVDGVSYLGDGGSTDFSKIEDDGTLEFNGAATVWDDIQVSAGSASRLGFTDPDWAQFQDDGSGSTGVYQLAFDNTTDEELYFTAELPHGWKLGSTIYPHVHWSPEDTNTGNVVWGLEYTISAINGTFGNSTKIRS